MGNRKHKESRDVPLGDIAAISDDMTQCINNHYTGKILQPSNQQKLTENASLLNEDVEIDIIDGSQGHTPIPSNISNHEKKRQSNIYTFETSDDNNRKELLWTTKIEDVIRDWHSKCVEFSDIHGIRSKYHKKIFYGLGIPAAIIPMTLAAVSDIITDDWRSVMVICLIITGILNIIIGFLNSGKRAEAHLNFEALYSELSIEITSELVKPQSYRQDADVFIQRIMDRFNSLNNRAPQT